MFNASSVVRTACCAACCALALLLSTASAETIDVSLNVFYANPANASSGGTWEIVAKTSSEYGIAGLNMQLTNIKPTPAPENQAPRGNVNGSDPAGFSLFDVFAQTGYRQILVGQDTTVPEGVFYGVGTIANGTPGAIGPAPGPLSNLQDVPWATGDAFSNPAWSTAARFASGTFAINLTPAFFSGSTGNVFLTPDPFGVSGPISLNTIVRTNFVANPLPDYNRNGTVDAADYVLWRHGDPSADGNNDTFVNEADYNLWRTHFGQTTSGAGGGDNLGLENSLVGSSVPEPTSAVLLAVGALGTLLPRRRTLVFTNLR